MSVQCSILRRTCNYKHQQRSFSSVGSITLTPAPDTWKDLHHLPRIRDHEKTFEHASVICINILCCIQHSGERKRS
uniref:Uncharacterized protein n=1 Tax=Pyxicephalus adspersus TaxID=30357 RepID=A0AAV2ZFM5_PYXAD|nr:TPA: hypothetical protein GDO54_004572 [Pyxicephalus adspersus]